MQTSNFQHGDPVEVRGDLIDNYSPHCYFTLTIRDEEISIHLDRPEEMVLIGQRIMEEGLRLQQRLDDDDDSIPEPEAQYATLPPPF